MLVGDSIMRNQWESLVCLVESVVPTDRKTVTYASPTMAFHALVRDPLYSKPCHIPAFMIKLVIDDVCLCYYVTFCIVFLVQDFETSIEFCWAPLLVELKKGLGNKMILHLDLIEENAKYWRAADVLVFDSAHWWTHSDKWTS